MRRWCDERSRSSWRVVTPCTRERRVGKVTGGDRVRKLRQVAQCLPDGVFNVASRAAGVGAIQFPGVNATQPGAATLQNRPAGAGSRGVLTRQMFEMLGELVKLEQHRPW